MFDGTEDWYTNLKENLLVLSKQNLPNFRSQVEK